MEIKETLTNGGELKVGIGGWSIEYYFMGPDRRYNGMTMRIYESEIDDFIDAWIGNYNRYKALKSAFPNEKFQEQGAKNMYIYDRGVDMVGNDNFYRCTYSCFPVSSDQDLESTINELRDAKRKGNMYRIKIEYMEQGKEMLSDEEFYKIAENREIEGYYEKQKMRISKSIWESDTFQDIKNIAKSLTFFAVVFFILISCNGKGYNDNQDLYSSYLIDHFLYIPIVFFVSAFAFFCYRKTLTIVSARWITKVISHIWGLVNTVILIRAAMSNRYMINYPEAKKIEDGMELFMENSIWYWCPCQYDNILDMEGVLKLYDLTEYFVYVLLAPYIILEIFNYIKCKQENTDYHLILKKISLPEIMKDFDPEK